VTSSEVTSSSTRRSAAVISRWPHQPSTTTAARTARVLPPAHAGAASRGRLAPSAWGRPRSTRPGGAPPPRRGRWCGRSGDPRRLRRP
jgi:hypothetical protein